MALSADKRGKAELEPMEIDPAKRGGWRVEEEFVFSRGRRARCVKTSWRL
jgi:hypothetical protein